jgi:CrcB protein
MTEVTVLIPLSIAVFGALGCLVRWQLGVLFNPIFPTLPLGTVAANFIGGLVIGLSIELFALNAAIPPVVRLSATTGFCGGLTTFSTFSAEVVTLILRKQYNWAVYEVCIHLFGSLILTLLGVICVRALWAWATPA